MEKSRHPFFNSGINHPAYTSGSGRGYNYRETKKNLQILGAVCFQCSATKNLYVHHMDKNPRNNKLVNLQILCRSCHARHHWNGRRKHGSPEESRAYYSKRVQDKKHKILQRVFFRKFKTKIFYKATDICKEMNISRERVRQLRVKGRLPHIKHGAAYLYLNNSC